VLCVRACVRACVAGYRPRIIRGGSVVNVRLTWCTQSVCPRASTIATSPPSARSNRSIHPGLTDTRTGRATSKPNPAVVRVARRGQVPCPLKS
jgi:hypothetical protein